MIIEGGFAAVEDQASVDKRVDEFWELVKKYVEDDVRLKDKPFTILAPQNSVLNGSATKLLAPDAVKKLVDGHVVPDLKLDLAKSSGNISVTTLDNRTIEIKTDGNGTFWANNATVVEKEIVVPNGILVIVDGYLFPQPTPVDGSTTEQPPKLDPKRDEKQANLAPRKPPFAAPKASAATATTASSSIGAAVAAKNQSNVTFVENVMEVLSFLKSGVRVFQHFLSRSNVSRMLKEGEEYTVFVPTDHAFQRWHPIDWGFYPFSVPEFTESVIVNHFVKGRLKPDNIKDGQVVETLGGREIAFKRTPVLTANGAAVVKGDTPLKKGNIVFIGEVLFVSESVVSKLHQQHRDKETPPLLAFPWFGAQFLSHAFLALERDKRFTHITRFLNLADLAPHVSGAGYTFFVPTDTAFEELGLDKMPDNYLSNGEGLEILLNHFVKGRLYDKDLKNGTVLNTLGNQTLTVERTPVDVHINEAVIVESEVFVYNLGTMFYIDKVLYATIKVPSIPIGGALRPTQATTTTPKPTTRPTEFTTAEDTETVTGVLTGEQDSFPEVLFGDGTQESVTSDVEYTTQSTKQNSSSLK